MSKAKGHKKRRDGAGSKAPVRAIIAIDPGESAGIAVIQDGKVLFSSPAVGSKWRLLAPAVKAAWEQSGCTVPLDQVVGVCEQGWVAGRGMAGQMTLSQRRGIAQAAMEYIGVTRFEFVSSSVWMNAYYGGIHGKDTKELAMQSAKSDGNYVTTHDEADAHCLAMWSWREFCK